MFIYANVKSLRLFLTKNPSFVTREGIRRYVEKRVQNLLVHSEHLRIVKNRKLQEVAIKLGLGLPSTDSKAVPTANRAFDLEFNISTTSAVVASVLITAGVHFLIAAYHFARS